MNNPVLECRNLTKEYVDANQHLKILTGINLSVREGEQLAIMGRSGSGKTTLLQLLGGLDTPTRGEVWVKGKNLHTLPAREQESNRNQTIGFVFQFHHLLAEFTAVENVAMPLLIARVAPDIATKRAKAILAEVGLAARFSHKPGELSGGERQRVAIARALVNQPACLLADEPTGNLDAETAEEVFGVLTSINRNFKTSIILVTHDLNLAESLDRVFVLQGGNLEAIN